MFCYICIEDYGAFTNVEAPLRLRDRSACLCCAAKEALCNYQLGTYDSYCCGERLTFYKKKENLMLSGGFFLVRGSTVLREHRI